MSTVLERRVQAYLTEARLKPLKMTGDQKIEFLSELCSGFKCVEATALTPQLYTVFSRWFTETSAPTFSEAICIAAAKWEQINK
jgi:hypothetical protein